MTIQMKFTRGLAASAALAIWAMGSTPSMALDADDIATKLAAVASQGGAKMTFGSVSAEGGTVVLKTARFTPAGQQSLDLGDITLSGVEEEDDGGYYIGQAEFDDVNVTTEEGSLSIVDLEMTGLVIPAELAYESLDDIMFYESFSTGEITASQAGQEVFSMSGVDVNVDRAGDNSAVDVVMVGSGMRIDLSQVKDAKAKEALSQLGYQTLTGDMKIDAGWEVDSGTFNMREYSLTLNDVGRLAMALEISGYTLEFINAMQQAQAAAAANPDPQAAQQAMGFAMMGMMQQLTFNSASVRFDDASLTRRALDFAGKQQGVSGEQMGQALKGMLPLMLGQLGIPALQQQISAAANVYLDNPGNITITAKPAQPVAVPVIMGAGMGNPKSLVDLLNVQVTANQ